MKLMIAPVLLDARSENLLIIFTVLYTFTITYVLQVRDRSLIFGDVLLTKVLKLFRMSRTDVHVPGEILLILLP